MALSGFEKWPLCMLEAKRLVQELKLEYYSDPKRLTFIEALYILSTKATLNPEFTLETLRVPWKVIRHPEEDKVNRLLHRSLQVQMGRITNTEFKDFILSNACLGVTGLVHLYLKHLGVDSKIVSGVFCFSTKFNSDGTPHVWLEIDGNPVETTYVNVANGDPNLIFKMKSPELLVKEDLTSTSRNLFYGQDDLHESRANAPHSLKLFTLYANEDAIEKYIVASIKMAAVNPRIKMYDVLMKDFMRKDFKVVVDDLEKKWDAKCWKCLSENNNVGQLKTCSGCKLAKYCNPQCQKSDWSHHKILHKEIDHIASSLSRN